MFTATILDTTLQALLAGEMVTVYENDEPAMHRWSAFPPRDRGSYGIPEDGTHWMILNGEKLLVRVQGEASDPEGCPCCAWEWVTFKVVG